ncbi:protocatechuate 3,4-dioxygenase subunit alpha [Mycobacterium sp. CBMA271]|uniref:protocatechuate 3,4-dioxygenase subunit alpha n=1 Tax=unclassified Mycobacteroides TaxID=2618759 RepID=UPI0012DD3265|nr:MULTISPECIES: protocatechuate 3,4-dioxygenase subunit alpha [unclassified Mycobacteroides]MUM16817.1 protocatechuate 3,4-dioxygenase subunit alpha [Mycobacteroides sp. CBMA 326]MUM20290.1 protocatechuate 3,4-dioxygenase subunit alpha [Mycobacteroides sp. CBMA 271]
MGEAARTAGQTVGPFFAPALTFPDDCRLVPRDSPASVTLHGFVYDGEGNGIPDAVVEVWQPDSAGNVSRHPGSLRRNADVFTGWGRCATDGDGHYEFTTVTPGSVAGAQPFFALVIFARGLLNRLFTRAYLPAESDRFLDTLDPARRNTLICTPEPSGYRFDIRIQGPGETVFLEYRGIE